MDGCDALDLIQLMDGCDALDLIQLPSPTTKQGCSMTKL